MRVPVDAEPSLPHEPPDRPWELDEEWDAVFCWSYGQRLWNVGCG